MKYTLSGTIFTLDEAKDTSYFVQVVYVVICFSINSTQFVFLFSREGRVHERSGAEHEGRREQDASSHRGPERGRTREYRWLGVRGHVLG